MTTLYIAGPMKNRLHLNYPAFNDAAALLRAFGFVVRNPARHEKEGRTLEEYVRLGLLDVFDCDGVAVLPDWQLSKGARLEVEVALALNKPVLLVADWLDKRPI